MIIVNIDHIPNKEVEILGMVKGNCVQSKNIGKDIGSGLKSLVGGEIKAYSQMMNESRAIATKRMVEEAQELGAEAILNVRYTSSAVMASAAEILVYGTAVKFV